MNDDAGVQHQHRTPRNDLDRQLSAAHQANWGCCFFSSRSFRPEETGNAIR
jgi:hypothetical protein